MSNTNKLANSDSSPRNKHPKSAVVTARRANEFVRLLLFVRAGGLCQFDGCNKYLLEHHVTLARGNFAQVAHIVAFRENGPRGKSMPRPKDINSIDNLMLLCPGCHKLVDDNPHRHTRPVLEKYKEAHETRIRHVTDLGQDRKTVAVVLKARIAGQTVSFPFDQIVEATAPYYPISRDPLTIDLTDITQPGQAFIKAACGTIKQRVGEFLVPGGVVSKVGHLSIFALAPIPLLVYFGHQLSNKVPCELFQRHRDTEDWAWKNKGEPVRYRAWLRRNGGRKKVALVISLSGKVSLKALPDDVLKKATIYEITLSGQPPTPTYLGLKQSLDDFRVVYQTFLARIVAEHGVLPSIDLFPAVPAPIAVLCGRELLPKVHPKLRVYDYDRLNKGFKFQLEV